MAANYITSAEQTMMLVRRIAAHLAVEPNLPAPEDLTRGEIDAWIRALNTGIHGRVIDLLALPVLECLLYMRGRNLGCKTKHLRRAPSEMFQPVVVNPWVREDVTLHREHLPWIPGDIHRATENNDNEEDAVFTHEQAIVVHQGDDVEADFTMPDGESTQLDSTQQSADLDDGNHDSTLQITEQRAVTEQQGNQLEQNIDQDDDDNDDGNNDDRALQTTEQSDVEEVASMLPENLPAKITYRTRSQAVQNADIVMQNAPEQDDSSSDDPDRVYCICDGSVDGGTMVQCDNHKDSDCKGKWFHLKCVGLMRSPADDVHWYCMDCRKKLRRGLFSGGVVR
ncbi:hypothetical protein QM012_001440 [Aureobasidium pullulans]|uniref:PHD-type domain-containing protein n=1 Tax=Aureobasidium pullulans TaxID=5580 RepID=A0ABR0TFK8_AURPU